MTKYKSIIYCIPFIIICALFPGVSSADTIIEDPFFLQNAAINNGGVYTLTQADSPYYFEYSSYIDKDITINIEPGVEIHLNNSGNFYVNNGTINFKGTKDSPIMFGANGAASSLGFWAESNGDHLVKLNINNTHFHNMRSVYMSRNVVANINDVVLSNMKITPLGFSQNVKVKINGIQYKDISMHTPTHLINVYPSDDVFSLDPMILEITNSDFVYNEYLPFLIYISDHRNQLDYKDAVQIKISHSVFDGYSQISPFYYRDAASIPIDARNNYWGTPDGPYHTGSAEITNGPQLPVFVEYVPFLTSEIGSETKEESENDTIYKECCSSVIFLPGIQGSRLYKQRLLGGEDQLWEANWNSDLSDLGLDSEGNSLINDIYTRDIIERTNIVPDIIEILTGNIDRDIYKSTLEFLENQRNSDSIKSFYSYAYDWRLDLDTIINQGAKQESGEYIKLIDKIKEQSLLSSTGKVTIVAHSMGGLLTKRFIQTLSPDDQKLIDKVVFIAVPHIGTPEGASAVLNGIEFNDFYKFFAKQKYNRRLAENMVTAQALVPSDEYFNIVQTEPIIFSSGVSDLLPEILNYNGMIDTGQEMREFLTGIDGRIDAEFIDVGYPGTSPVGVVNKAKNIHENIDKYVLPNNIQVHQIAGSGIPTLKQIEYFKKVFKNNMSEVSYKIHKTFGGDGTVVRESASYYNSPTYYIDLNKYNKDNNSNHNHKDISSMDPVLGILTNIFKNEPIQENIYISHTAQNFATEKYFMLGMYSPVDIHLYDSQGRHTGPIYIDLDGEKVRIIEENIPNTSYEEYGEGKYITGMDNQDYVLKLEGYDDGEFTLDLTKFVNDQITSYQVFSDLPSNKNMRSTVNMYTDNPIQSISLDLDTDNNLDLQINNNGEIVNLKTNKTPIDEIKKGVDTSNIPKQIANHGAVVLPLYLGSNTQKLITLNTKEEIISVISAKPNDTVKAMANKIQPTPKPVKVLKVNTSKSKNDTINKVESLMVVEPNTTNKIKASQLASVASSDISKRFNLLEFIKRLLKWKK